MSEQLKALTTLEPQEVSLVTRGANKKKRFPITKGADFFQNVIKTVLESETDDESKLEAVLKVCEVSEQGIAASKGALRLLTAFKDEIPADVLAKLEEIAGYEAKSAEVVDKDLIESKPTNEASLPEAAKEDKMEELKKEEIKEVEKSADYELIIKAHKEELEVVKKAHADLVAQLAVEKSARELEQWTAKCKENLSHYPGKSFDEMGFLLKRLAEVDPKLADEQFEVMKLAATAVKKSALFTESGNPQAQGSVSSSAEGKVNALAAQLVEKSATPLSKEQAVVRVLRSHPDLYREFEQERNTR